MAAFALNNVYNHYLSTYAPKLTRYDTHKKDELKQIYRRIVKQAEDSPLYLPDYSKKTQVFAVGLKEDARDLKNAISSLTSDHSSSVLDKRVAYSSDGDILDVKYIGSDGDIDASSDFDIEVHSLASTQVNIGRYLPNEDMYMEPDSYSFDLEVNDTDYEFQFSIDEDDTNRDIQDKIARLINRSNIGVSASVIESGDSSAIRLESVNTGKRDDDKDIFTISDNNTSRRSGAVDYFGLDNIAHDSTNAVFSLNGTEKTAYSNNFTVGKAYEVTLKGLSGDHSPVHVGIKADVEALTENIGSLAGAYNDFIRRAAEYTQNYNRSNKIMREMGSLANRYSSSLDAVGLSMKKDGTIDLNQDLLYRTAEIGDPKTNLSAVQHFANALVRKSNEISLNPMNYADQVIVAYKNPGKNFPDPYNTSMYTGMMFSSYC